MALSIFAFAVVLTVALVLIFMKKGPDKPASAGVAEKNEVPAAADTPVLEADTPPEENVAVVTPTPEATATPTPEPTPVISHPDMFYEGYTVFADENTEEITSEEILSSYAVLVDLKDGHIVAQRNPMDKIYPASMTKVMTVLVAAEHMEDPDAMVTMTREITDFVFLNDLSAVGYEVGEQVSVMELFYGTILRSGGDAALALAEHIGGSEDAFVAMMNDKLKELGFDEVAHFSNPVGHYEDDNYCTPVAMAMIMKAAMENDICREVMCTKRYNTASNEFHPDGIDISNLFLRRIEDLDTHGEVLAAKTGYVIQSRNCAVSYEESNDGNRYILVTSGAPGSWKAIYDHEKIYASYVN